VHHHTMLAPIWGLVVLGVTIAFTVWGEKHQDHLDNQEINKRLLAEKLQSQSQQEE